MMKCICGCGAEGEPEPGYRIFACDGCLTKLLVALEAEADARGEQDEFDQRRGE